MLPIYLDYNATTPIAPEVAEAMRPFLEREFGNPSSSHLYGRRAHAAVEGLSLLTRDPRRHRKYFPALRIVSP